MYDSAFKFPKYIFATTILSSCQNNLLSTNSIYQWICDLFLQPALSFYPRCLHYDPRAEPRP